jgi:hypothetical protein
MRPRFGAARRPLIQSFSVQTPGPRSSGDRAPPSGGGSAGSNPAGGASNTPSQSLMILVSGPMRRRRRHHGLMGRKRRPAGNDRCAGDPARVGRGPPGGDRGNPLPGTDVRTGTDGVRSIAPSATTRALRGVARVACGIGSKFGGISVPTSLILGPCHPWRQQDLCPVRAMSSTGHSQARPASFSPRPGPKRSDTPLRALIEAAFPQRRLPGLRAPSQSPAR